MLALPLYHYRCRNPECHWEGRRYGSHRRHQIHRSEYDNTVFNDKVLDDNASFYGNASPVGGSNSTTKSSTIEQGQSHPVDSELDTALNPARDNIAEPDTGQDGQNRG